MAKNDNIPEFGDNGNVDPLSYDPTKVAGVPTTVPNRAGQLGAQYGVGGAVAGGLETLAHIIHNKNVKEASQAQKSAETAFNNFATKQSLLLQQELNKIPLDQYGGYDQRQVDEIQSNWLKQFPQQQQDVAKKFASQAVQGWGYRAVTDGYKIQRANQKHMAVSNANDALENYRNTVQTGSVEEIARTLAEAEMAVSGLPINKQKEAYKKIRINRNIGIGNRVASELYDDTLLQSEQLDNVKLSIKNMVVGDPDVSDNDAVRILQAAETELNSLNALRSSTEIADIQAEREDAEAEEDVIEQREIRLALEKAADVAYDGGEVSRSDFEVRLSDLSPEEREKALSKFDAVMDNERLSGSISRLVDQDKSNEEIINSAMNGEFKSIDTMSKRERDDYKMQVISALAKARNRDDWVKGQKTNSEHYRDAANIMVASNSYGGLNANNKNHLGTADALVDFAVQKANGDLDARGINDPLERHKEKTKAQADMIAKIGFIPPKKMDEWASALSSGSDAEIMNAMAEYSMIRSRNVRHIAGSVGKYKREFERLELIAHTKGLYNVEKQIEFIKFMRTPDYEQWVEPRTAEVKKYVAEALEKMEMPSDRQTIYGRNVMSAVFTDAFKRSYIVGGSKETALEMANAAVARNFGGSDLIGGNRVMYLPPEKTIGGMVPDVPSGAVEFFLKEKVKDYLVDNGLGKVTHKIDDSTSAEYRGESVRDVREVNLIAGIEDYRLVTDYQTDNEYANNKDVLSYSVVIQRGKVWEPVKRISFSKSELQEYYYGQSVKLKRLGFSDISERIAEKAIGGSFIVKAGMSLFE